MKSLLAAVLLISAAPTALLAQERDEGVYTVGELQITAQSRTGDDLGGAEVAGETLQTYNRQTLGQALALIPGTNASNSGGSRNEQVIYIRGFDRFQTTVSIDGVRVFLPADNRIDFARFLTADVSKVQVSKGYVSVLDGPGGLGGAINLVTIKPTRALEGELKYVGFADRVMDNEARQISGRLGSRKDDYYWQVSGVINDREHFSLSRKFTPTAFEDGGARDHSATYDWRFNAKAGWQPNETDEYSINYTKSEGTKSAPDHVSDATGARFWEWPYWNLSNTSLLTRTRLSDALTLKSRFYVNGFDNLLVGYDNASRTTQTLPRSFFSYYQDEAQGGNVELDYDINDASQLKGVFYVRRDLHHERQDGFIRTPATGSPSGNAPYHEPWQTNDELTYSAAAQYSTGLGDNIDVTVGASYDWTDLRVANEINARVVGTTIANSVIVYDPVNFPLKDNTAINAQAAITWRPVEGSSVYASVSDRTRFPTLFERFSARFGSAVPNPGIKEERAINYEAGGQTKVGLAEVKGAVFYSDVRDALIQVPVVLPVFGAVNQTRNVGKGEYYGFELEAKARLNDNFEVGGNYTYLRRTLTDTSTATPTNVVAQGVPISKAFAYASWQALPGIWIRPNVEYASDRYSVKPTGAFAHDGAYTLINMTADWEITKAITGTFGVQNLGDVNYALFDGFPEAGRSFFMGLRARF